MWITKAGQCILANNNSRIPESDLKELFDAISTQYFVIVKRWKEVFNTDEIKVLLLKSGYSQIFFVKLK